MTVSSTDSIVAFVGNGAQTAFPCSFKMLGEEHARVHVDGVLQVLNTDYTLSGVPGDSFTVNFVAAPANMADISIERVLPFTQETDYLENDEFPAETHERALDLLTMMIQQVAQGKLIRFPVSDPAALTGVLPVAAERAQKLLGFASNGDVVAVDGADLGAFSVGDPHTWTAQQIMQMAANADAWTLRNLSGVTLAKFRHTSGGFGSLIVTDAAGGEGVIQGGAGDPEGVRGANPGTLFLRSNGGVGTTAYLKESGSGNTGWKPVGLAVPDFVALSGATHLVTGIRLARRVTIFLSHVSGSTADAFELVIGPSSGVETTNYFGRRSELLDASAAAINAQNNAFGIHGAAAAGDDYHGKIVLELMDASTNRWHCEARIFSVNSLAREYLYNGHKVLSGELERFQLQRIGGTFDNGSLSYRVE